MASLGRYELRDRLGRGGFATVYRAWDPMLRREVALKALSLDLAEEPEMRRRFLAEAQALASLKHPHVVAVYDVGETAERPFFAMELIAGQTLDTWLAARGRLELPETVAIIGELADALDMLHAAGLVHRDVKAPNVMLAQERGQQRVVLMDLGIARHLAGPRFTATDLLLLSAETAAPEQIQNQPLGPATDIYALGVVTYQMLAGRPPFLGDTAALLYAHVHAPPAPLWELRPGLPGPVYAVLDEALAKDPARRPASAGDFAAALQAATLPATRPLPAVKGLDASKREASVPDAEGETTDESDSQSSAGPAVVEKDDAGSRPSETPITTWWTQPAVLVMGLCALLIMVAAFLPWSAWRVERVSVGRYGPVPGVRAVGLQYTVVAGLLLNHELSEPRNFTLVAPNPADLPEVFNVVPLGTGWLTLAAALGAVVALVRRPWLGYALVAFLSVWVLSAGDMVVKALSSSQDAGTAVFGDLSAAEGLYLTAAAAFVAVMTALVQLVRQQPSRVRRCTVIALTGAALLLPLVEALNYYQMTIA